MNCLQLEILIIPNYNGRQLLEQNLPGVLAALVSGDELLIVDDASSDDSVEWLVERFKLTTVKLEPSAQLSSTYYPQPAGVKLRAFQSSVTTDGKSVSFTLLALTHNLRFGGAVNAGAAFAQHQLFFLCNSDVVPAPDALGQLTPYFSDPEVCAVGCKEFEGDDRHHPSGKNRLWFERGLFQHTRAIDFSAGETAWASGGSAMIAAEKWFALDGFDQRYYPAYWEDTDFSFQARRRGWKVLFEPAAVVYHTHESTNQPVFGAKKITAMSWKNAYAFTWKNGSVWQRLQFLTWLPYWTWKQYVH